MCACADCCFRIVCVLLFLCVWLGLSVRRTRARVCVATTPLHLQFYIISIFRRNASKNTTLQRATAKRNRHNQSHNWKWTVFHTNWWLAQQPHTDTRVCFAQLIAKVSVSLCPPSDSTLCCAPIDGNNGQQKWSRSRLFWTLSSWLRCCFQCHGIFMSSTQIVRMIKTCEIFSMQIRELSMSRIHFSLHFFVHLSLHSRRCCSWHLAHSQSQMLAPPSDFLPFRLI